MHCIMMGCWSIGGCNNLIPTLLMAPWCSQKVALVLASVLRDEFAASW